MNIILFSDLHLHEHQTFVDVVGSQNDNIFIDTAFSCLDQIFNYAVENQIKHIFHLGDLFHQKSRVPVRLIYKLQSEFVKWSEYKINTYLLKGNIFHDGDGDDFNGNVLKHISGVRAIDEPSVILDEILAIPYGRKSDIIKYIDKFRKAGKRKILLLHKGLSGAKVNESEIFDEDNIDENDLSEINFTFAGHYHKYQKVFSKAWHVGSPYRITFAEKDDKKGFIHFNNGDVKFIELDVPGMIEMDSKEKIESVSNCFVKVLIKGNDAYVKKFNYQETKRMLLLQGALGVRFETISENDLEEIREVRISKNDNYLTMIEKYLSYVESETEGLNVDLLKNIAKEAIGGDHVN